MISRFIFLTLLVVLQFSCSEFLKGKPKKQETIQVSKESLSCLKGVTKKWKTFLNSETNEKEIDQVFSCIDSTLNEFQSRIEGKVDAQSFTNEELFQIFNKYINEADISQAATNDLLVLKSAVLGGDSNKITKKEISDLRSYLLLLKVEAKALLPYAELFKFKKTEITFSKKMLSDGFGQLNLSLKNLFKASKIYRSDYQLSDLQKLLMNLKILDQQQSDLLGLANKVKDLLVGNNQSLQSESDYMVFIDNLTEVLRLYSYQLQGYVKFEIENADTLNDAIEYVESWLNLLQNSLQFKRNKIISIETLDPLIQEIAHRGLIPVQVKSDTLLHFYKILIMRVFDSGINANVSSFIGLNKSHFEQIKREIVIYKLYMQFLYETTRSEVLKSEIGQERIPISLVQKKLKAFVPQKEGLLNSLDEPTKKVVISAFEELKSEFLTQRPVVYRFKQMVIAANQEIWDQNWQDLARAVYVKMLSRELMIGWGSAFSSKMLSEASLTEEQLIQWYSDFKQFGIESKIFDPRSKNSGSTSFKQANLLTYAADGDQKMNFAETYQYLNMLLSGGGETLAEMYEGFQKAGCQLPEKDVFDNNWLNEACVKADLRLHYKKYFTNLSYLTMYLSQLNDKKFFEFYDQAMDVARVNSKFKGQKLETADLRTMSILLHSIESLYATFDSDRNSSFSAAEIRSAYPRFKNFAQEYAHTNAQASIDKFNSVLAQTVGGYGCYSEQDLIRESFIYLVFNGSTPSSTDLNNIPCFLNINLMDFSGQVDRLRIINTFKILKSVLGS